MPPGFTVPYVRRLRSVRLGFPGRLVADLADVGEQFGQPPMRPMRARLDRADRDTEGLGDLGVGEAVEPRQLDHPTFVVRQLVESDPHLPRLPGRLQRHGGGRVVELFGIDGARAAIAAIGVDRLPPGDRVEPRRQLLIGIEAAGRLPCVDERRLDDVGRPTGIAEDRQRHGVDRAAEALVHVAEHGVVGSRKADRQLPVAHGHHGRMLSQPRRFRGSNLPRRRVRCTP